MTDTGVIDRFFETFNRYIDSGFGLLGGEVAFLSTTLVAIDVTLAALFWAWASGEDVIARLVKKTLYVGFFAFLIGNFHTLSTIVLKSFAGLGLKASGSGLSAEDLLRPGKVAATGISAIKPLLEAAGELSGFPALFENLIQVLVLLFSALVILVAFFVMAVQIFVVLIEFKLTTLAGFVLVPFGLFGRTAFLAERVLGGVVAAGVKVLVLAVIVGIGTSLFDEFTTVSSTDQPTLEAVLALTLAAITLLGLSIFGPGIAAGLVSGAPQLGAGAAVGTGLMIGGMAMAGASAARMIAGGGASLAAGAAGGRLPPSGSPPSGPSGGPQPSPQGPSPASPGEASPSAKSERGGAGGGGSKGGSGSGSGADGQDAPEAAAADKPQWAHAMQNRQALAHGAGLALHAVSSGDSHGGAAAPSLSEDR